MPKSPDTLWVVRVKKERHYWRGNPLRTGKPSGLEAAFATREEAEAFQIDLEQRAAEAGDPGPLLEVGSLAGLLKLSDFEPGVFRDWLLDHDLFPDPEAFVGTRRAQETDRFVEWLRCLSARQLAGLYAAPHRFRFFEVVSVPFVAGDYPEERWDEWEKNLPAELPGPEGEYDGFHDEEDGFTAEPTGWPPPDYLPVAPLGGGDWDQVLPPESPAEPAGPPSPDDEIPF